MHTESFVCILHCYSVEQTCRGMYTAKAHNGCGADVFWMNLIQNQVDTSCSYEKIQMTELPKLLYSGVSGASFLMDSK